jgi:type IV secretion system protein TrbB
MEHAVKQQRIYEKLNRELGAEILSYLSNPHIVEILLNPDGKLWVDHLREGMVETTVSFNPLEALQLIGTVATLAGTVVNEKKPILETELPIRGSRFEAIIPPVVKNPCFCIRKHAEEIYTFADYIAQGILTDAQAEQILTGIQRRASILIVGGPGTGKTTFANAVLHEMVQMGDSKQRFLILEETRELQCAAKNVVYLKTTDHVNFQELLRATLRLRPDKICLGECRGAEMLTLLKAWNTGAQGGLATLHANSANSALIRVAEMAEESGSHVSPYLICESISLVVAMEFHPTKGRSIQAVSRVVDYKDAQYVLQNLA